MNGAGPGTIRIEPVKQEWADALSHGDAEFTRRFGAPVEADWAGFPEALPIIITAALEGEPGQWGPHLFFGEDGVLIGNGGWKGPPMDGAAELGYAVAPARQGRGIATAVVRELVRRARVAGLQMVFAHTLAAKSASTSVLARCGFAKVAELIDSDEGPVWRWELHLDDHADNVHDRASAASRAARRSPKSVRPIIHLASILQPRIAAGRRAVIRCPSRCWQSLRRADCTR